MKKIIRFIGTWLLAITLLISCMSPMCVQAASNTKVAKTQKQLEKLLADKNTKTIKLITNTNTSSLIENRQSVPFHRLINKYTMMLFLLLNVQVTLR